MTDLKMTGNALKGSRPIISFGKEFEENDQNKLMKEILGKVFNVEQNYPKSKPFIDHTLQFSIVDDHVWMRNYQIVEGDGDNKLSLVEIGPRYCMQCIKILTGCFSGSVAYLNEKFVSPNVIRSEEKRELQIEAARKKKINMDSKSRRMNLKQKQTLLDKVFDKDVDVEEEN